MDWIQAGSLLAVILFYAAYFAKQMILRRQGVATNRLAKGDKPRRTFIIEAWLLIVTYAMGIVQVASILFPKHLTIFIGNTVVRTFGIGIALIGVLFFVCALITMKNCWRAGIDRQQKTTLVAHGIYRFSRNPAFVGFDLLYIGLSLAYSNVLNIDVSLLAVVLLHLQIREEEKYLPVVFGEEYALYQARTKRYLLFF